MGAGVTDIVDLKVTVQAVDDATVAEIGAAAHRLSQALADRPEVTDLRPVTVVAPTGAKAGIEVAALGQFLLSVAPAVIEPVLGMVRDLLSRPGATPTKVTVEREGQKVVVEFDPRRTSADEIAALTRQLTAGLRDAG